MASYHSIDDTIIVITFEEAYDVGVLERGGNLNLPLDVNFVKVVCDTLLTDSLDGHLRKQMFDVVKNLFFTFVNQQRHVSHDTECTEVPCDTQDSLTRFTTMSRYGLSFD